MAHRQAKALAKCRELCNASAATQNVCPTARKAHRVVKDHIEGTCRHSVTGLSGGLDNVWRLTLVAEGGGNRCPTGLFAPIRLRGLPRLAVCQSDDGAGADVTPARRSSSVTCHQGQRPWQENATKKESSRRRCAVRRCHQRHFLQVSAPTGFMAHRRLCVSGFFTLLITYKQ